MLLLCGPGPLQNCTVMQPFCQGSKACSGARVPQGVMHHASRRACKAQIAMFRAQGAKRARGRGEAAKLTSAGNLLLRYAERMLVLATDAIVATKDLQVSGERCFAACNMFPIAVCKEAGSIMVKISAAFGSASTGRMCSTCPSALSLGMQHCPLVILHTCHQFKCIVRRRCARAASTCSPPRRPASTCCRASSVRHLTAMHRSLQLPSGPHSLT